MPLKKEGMNMKKGFATSAVLYTMLLLFIILLVNILDNLQNKKTILDTLKRDTISALQRDTVVDSILEQITIINNKIVEFDTRMTDYEANTYTKEESDTMMQTKIQESFHRIYSNEIVSLGTEFIYTGVDVTIPKNTYFCLSTAAMKGSGNPISVAISTSSNENNYLMMANHAELGIASVTYCGYVDVSTSYYIWAKYDQLSNNNIMLSGFYITV